MNHTDLILYIVATIFFCLDGFRVPASVNFVSLGFAALTLSLIL